MKTLAAFVWVLMVIATGYTLFHITFQVEALEQQLSALNREILQEQETIHVLKAEWSYLNQPERVKALTEKFLPEMGDMSQPQMLRISELPEKPEMPPVEFVMPTHMTIDDSGGRSGGSINVSVSNLTASGG